MPSTAIIIPCYNEASRLPANVFIEFARTNPDFRFIFVDDGSSDTTLSTLEEIKQLVPQTLIIALKKNKGKGEAVRQGLLAALEHKFSNAGYLDADLSTSLEEFCRLSEIGKVENADVILGSRIKKIDTTIERSFARHVIGRILATVIDQKFKLGVYDTQCGAKIFRSTVLDGIIETPFQTKWFFDVEMIWRIKTKKQNFTAREVPLKTWRSVRNSKISLLSFPSVFKQIFVLLTKY